VILYHTNTPVSFSGCPKFISRQRYRKPWNSRNFSQPKYIETASKNEVTTASCLTFSNSVFIIIIILQFDADLHIASFNKHFKMLLNKNRKYLHSSVTKHCREIGKLLEVIGHIWNEIPDTSHHILNCDLHMCLNIYQCRPCKNMKFELSQPNCYIHVQ
jgi:hypothetical protein